MNEMDIDKLLPKIAHLYYLEDMNQDKIAEKFNINRVRVSRYLKKAREKKIVEIKVHYTRESYHELERIIEKQYGLKECIVIPTHDTPLEIIADLADSLSGVLQRILQNGGSVGVNWGLTLKEVVALMKSQRKIDIRVVPICGGLGKIERGIHTNAIARGLADVFGGMSYVINAPAILDSRKTRDFLLGDSNTREIFELLNELSCAVFSFSDLGHESSHVKYGFIGTDEVEYLRGLGVVGDVNLNFVDRNGSLVPNRVGDRIIALPLADIRSIRNVVGIAYGKRKGEITRAVLRGGIVDVLIIDRELAEIVISDLSRVLYGERETAS
jgi:DNA-binding transcriptional regulator LsrR (DeoR family)